MALQLMFADRPGDGAENECGQKNAPMILNWFGGSFRKGLLAIPILLIANDHRVLLFFRPGRLNLWNIARLRAQRERCARHQKAKTQPQ